MSIYDNARKTIEYLTALIEAHDAIESGKAVAPVMEDKQGAVMAQKTTARNIALAGSGAKAELMGTIEDEPTLDAQALIDVGIDEKTAAEIIIARDGIRADAIAMDAKISAVAVDVIEEVK